MPLEIETAELLVNLCPDTQEALMWGSRDAIPRYRPESIAFGLGRVKKQNSGAVYLLRIKYAGEDCWYDCELRLWIRIVDLANRQKWADRHEKRPEELYRRVGRLAIWEHVHPHVCPVCKGRAQALIENKLIQCDCCLGSGRVQMNDDGRAKVLGVDADYWKSWGQRYQRIRFILNAWEQKGLNILRNSL